MRLLDETQAPPTAAELSSQRATEVVEEQKQAPHWSHDPPQHTVDKEKYFTK